MYGVTSDDRYLVNPSKYWDESTPRILWLLKEVNDREGNYEMIPGLRSLVARGRFDKGTRATGVPLAKTSYGLLYPDSPWDHWSHSPRLYIGALDYIALINIKEIAGGPKSVSTELEAAFIRNGDRHWSSITALRPEIVIGGNTLDLCQAWFPDWNMSDPSLDGYDSRLIGGAIWVHANHPANHHEGETHLSYLQRIRSAIGRVR